MKLFQHDHRDRGERCRKVYAAYELAHTAADFGAALCFTVGSVLFFWPAYERAAIWLFTLGSVLFMAKPTIKMVREIRMLSIGDYEDLAEREEKL